MNMVVHSVAITTGTSVDRRRSAPNSQKDCLLSYIASILQGPSGSAGACWASTPHAKAAYISLRGGDFYRYMGHYVFMHFAPSFLPSRAGAVTRIYRSKRDRLGQREDRRGDARHADGPSNRARCGLTRSRSATLEPTKSGPTGETADETVKRQVMFTSCLLAPHGDDS